MKCQKKAIVLIVEKNIPENISSFRKGLSDEFTNAKIVTLEWLLDPGYTPMYGRSFITKEEYINKSIEKIKKQYQIIAIIDMYYQSRPDDLMLKFLSNDLKNLYFATGSSNSLDKYVFTNNNLKLVNQVIYNEKCDNFLINNHVNDPNYYLSYSEVKGQLINEQTTLHNIADIQNLPSKTVISYLNVCTLESLQSILKQNGEDAYFLTHFTLNRLMNYVSSQKNYEVYLENDYLFKVLDNGKLFGYFRVYNNKVDQILTASGVYIDKNNKICFDPYLVASGLYVFNVK